MSVKDMTPVSRPDMPAPGSADAETEGKDGPSFGDVGDTVCCGRTAGTAGTAAGVAGCDGEGEALSTIHTLCARVAINFETVCASEE